MAGTIRDRLTRSAVTGIVGREAELSALMAMLEASEPLVIHLHGLSGIGKSALVDAFAAAARARGATVVQLDGKLIEPTERGLLAELADALGGLDPTLPAVAARLGQLLPPVVLTLDSYELLSLLDAWLRRVFVPALPERVRVVLAGRLRPTPPWREQPWQGLFRTLPLELLTDERALVLLARLGVEGEMARRIVGLVGGHPLGLTLAGAEAAAWPASAALEVPAAMLHELAHRFLADARDQQAYEALRAACLLRRVTIPLLNALLPDAPADLHYTRLADLPYVTSSRDGLVVHDAVREAVAADLRAADPEAHRRYRLAAWRELNKSVRAAPPATLWRYTADLIYLIANPIVREAFFPRESARLTVEPAAPEERSTILALARAHEPPEAVQQLERWWSIAPEGFHVVRGPTGGNAISGFYCLLEPGRLPAAAVLEDPLARRWSLDLQARPIPGAQIALFLRRWLACDEGEAPSSVQAACWLDIKRHYMTLRPRLRRVYLPLQDPGPYAAAARMLGFVLLDDAVTIGGVGYRSAVLDMGPASVDGWLSGLLAAELGVREDGLLDHTVRGLRVEGRVIKLTRREFEVMRYLEARADTTVARDDLIHDVWGLRYEAGSNVVDAVIASLRRKLGSLAGAVQTVRGHGYLYHDPWLGQE
jgi:AAA ATPase domain